MTAVLHHVRIGHTDLTPHPEIHYAASHCLVCTWSTHLDDAERPRASGIEHATEAQHPVVYRDASAATVIEVTS